MDSQIQTVVRELGRSIWAIEQDFVRCFLIVGEKKALLFDTGVEPCGLPELLRSLTDREIILVQSHGDGDHTGSSGLFPVMYAHPADNEVFCRYRPELEGRLRPVREGDRFDLGGITLEVIETPGHTPGSICLLDRERRMLFSGDTVSFEPVFLFGEYRDIGLYRKTLDKLRTMGGFDEVYPCHGTCPIPPETIGDLMAAVDGTLDGTIPGTDTDGPPLPDGSRPLCYRSGSGGILYI